MATAAGDTSTERPATEDVESIAQDVKNPPSQTVSKDKSAEVVESIISHPSIFDPDVEDGTRNVWTRGCFFPIVVLMSGLWLKLMFRLPILLLRRTGGAFIIAFLCVLVFLCIPLACLETFTGQYGGKPFLLVMGEVFPIARGVGFAIVIDNFLELILFGINLSQLFTYCFFVFKTPVPWEKCDEKYNTPTCATDSLEEHCQKNKNSSGYLNHKCVPGDHVCSAFTLSYVNNSFCLNTTGKPGSHQPIYMPDLDRPTAQEQFYEGPIRNSGTKKQKDLHDLDKPSIKLLVALGAVWAVVMLCACGGLIPQPYIAWIVFPIPLVVYMVFMFSMLVLDGSSDGIKKLFSLDGRDLMSAQCWVDAAGLAFACMSVGYGTYPSLAAKNRTRRRSYCDVVVVGVLCFAVTLVTTLCFYGLVGSQAKAGKLTIDDQLKHNVDMARVLIPSELSRTSLSKVWSVMYFFAIVILGVGSMILHIACVVSDVSSTCQFKCHQAVACFVVLFFGLGMGLFFCFGGTIFILDTIEESILGSKKIVLSLLLLFVVIFLYGPRNLIHHIRKRQHIRLLPAPFFWQLSWYVLCPLGLLALPVLAVLGRGGTVFRDDVPLWMKLMAIGYEFYYWLIILAFLVQTAVAWRRPLKPRGVWRLQRDPDDDDSQNSEQVLRTETLGDIDSNGNPVKRSEAALNKDEDALKEPTTGEGDAPAGEGDAPAGEDDEELPLLPGEKRRDKAVSRIKGLERDPGPDEADLFVRLHDWSRGPPKPPKPPKPPPSPPRTPTPPPPPRPPSVDSIRTEYANFLGRQSPTMQARALPVPEQERVQTDGASRLPWRDQQMETQLGPHILRSMTPRARRGLFPGRGRVSAEPLGSHSPERWHSRPRSASAAAVAPISEEPAQPRDTSQDTPSLMDMLRNMNQ